MLRELLLAFAWLKDGYLSSTVGLQRSEGISGNRQASVSDAYFVAIAQYQKLEAVAEWNRVQSSLQLNSKNHTTELAAMTSPATSGKTDSPLSGGRYFPPPLGAEAASAEAAEAGGQVAVAAARPSALGTSSPGGTMPELAAAEHSPHA